MTSLRAGMAELIERARMLIGDAAGANQVFADGEVQDVLDAHGAEERYVPLTALQTIAPGGVTQYLIWVAEEGDWDEDVQLVDEGYNGLTPSTSDGVHGRWTFSSSKTSVLIVGKHYDMNAAAIELLTAWLAKVKLDFDFETDGQRFNRSQKAKQIEGLLARYQAQRPAEFGQMLRADVH